MKRVAFTIIYNGLHHLKHNDQWKFIVDNFDQWVIVEGAAKNGGSTAWCNDHPGMSHSTDGTREFVSDLCSKYDNVKFITNFGDSYWESKDAMVNCALTNLAESYKDEEFIFLWEIDADEQWSLDALEANEQALLKSGKNTGAVRWNHFVSHDLIAIGDWGGNLNTRLWIWAPGKQLFATHEPPIMQNSDAPIELPKPCNHFGYLFEKDVYFKSQYYGGHENIYEPWLKLQVDKERNSLSFPLHISFMFGRSGWIGKSNSHIIKYQES